MKVVVMGIRRVRRRRWRWLWWPHVTVRLLERIHGKGERESGFRIIGVSISKVLDYDAFRFDRKKENNGLEKGKRRVLSS